MLLFTPSGILSAGFYGPRGGDSTFYNFSSSTATSPAAGIVRLNNATPSAATAVYIAETNRDAVNVAAFLDQLTATGQFILVDDSNHANYATFTLVSMVDNGPNRTFNVTFVSSNGTLADNAKVWVSLIPPTVGTVGATGPAAVGFGDGSDGPLLCDGVAAVTGMTLVSANIYRLDRDIYATTLTVNNGVTVKPGNATAGSTPTWKIFCSVSLTNNGTIQTNGTDATNGVLAAAGAAGGAAGNSGGSLGGAGNGSAGRAGGTGVGLTSASGTATDPSSGGSGGPGATGGTGVSAGGGFGAGGVATSRPLRFIAPVLITLSSAGTITTLRGGGGGSGGGAGGGNGTASGGGSGGGGGGGGIVFIWAKSLTNSGTISANGGLGGNGGDGGTAGGGATGGGAGGGGGGGGLVYLIYNSITNSATISANGGTHGTGGNPGNAGTAGGNGSDGSAGLVLKFNTTTNSFE